MAFVIPNFSKTKVSRAGSILISKESTPEEYENALGLLNHWRACHAYPINTFQATLRDRLKRININALIAQRLKRTPSILMKLERNPGMQMARMQDIGGLRAVVSSISEVNKIHKIYEELKLTHEKYGEDDYIKSPKNSGYRSLHLIYKYKNPANPIYDGLCVELQIRTKLQHAWATAVETIGTYINQSLKSSEGSQEWLNYFKIVSAAFSHLEKCPTHPDFQTIPFLTLCQKVRDLSSQLDVIRKLNSFSIATSAIDKKKVQGNYHIILLDAKDKTVSITSYGQKRIEEANKDYSNLETVIKDDPDKQVVLVATNSVKALKKAYPNYFLDTKEFISALRRVEKICQAEGSSAVID